MEKLILFGGTFDPPHMGHMALLRAAIDTVHPDSVLVMPTGTPPHKGGHHADARVRLAMCRCFLPLFGQMVISDEEIVRGGKSYTVDTVRRLLERMPHTHIYLPVGSDMLLTFRKWREYRELLRSVTLVVHSRQGTDLDALAQFADGLRAEGGDIIMAPGEVLVLSSTEIREKIRRGEDVSDLVPAAALEIAGQYGLYREAQE